MMFYKTSIEVKNRVVVIFFSFKCLNHHLCSDFAYTIMVHAPHPSSSGDPHLFIQLQAHVSWVFATNLCQSLLRLLFVVLQLFDIRQSSILIFWYSCNCCPNNAFVSFFRCRHGSSQSVLLMLLISETSFSFHALFSLSQWSLAVQ